MPYQRTRKQLVHALVSVLLAQPASAAPWPSVGAPPGARTFPIAENVIHNGATMHITGFLSSESPASQLAWYRRHLPGRVLETQKDGRYVLTARQDAVLITVQLEGMPGGVRGLVAMTDVQGTLKSRRSNERDTAALLARLPSGSRILGRTLSQDSGRHATSLVIANALSPDMNADHLRNMLADDGLRLEREAETDVARFAGEGKVQHYRGDGKEATAIVYRDRSGQGAIVLHIVRTGAEP